MFPWTDSPSYTVLRSHPCCYKACGCNGAAQRGGRGKEGLDPFFQSAAALRTPQA